MSPLVFALYLVFIAGGIGGVVFLVHRLGWGRPLAIDPTMAVAAFAAQYPTLVVGKTHALPAAVLIEVTGGLGLVRAFGRRVLVRYLTQADVRAVRRRGDTVTIFLRDFAEPALHLRATLGEAPALGALIEAALASAPGKGA